MSPSTGSVPLDFTGTSPSTHGEESPYFAYCQQGELRIQYCAACCRHVFYPRFVCPSCLQRTLEWVPASGGGTVHTYTAQYRANDGYEGPLPFVIAVIELEEGVRMLSRVVADPADVHIGLRVTVEWATIDASGFNVPVFVPAAAGVAAA